MLPRPNNLPITVSVERVNGHDGHFLAKAGLEVIVNDQELILEGASYGKDEDLCLLKAKSEVVEKLFSHYLIANKTKYRGYSLEDITKFKYYSADEVVLGKGKDATGLAFGEEQLAIEHSILEVIERHLLAAFWYLGYKIEVFGSTCDDSYTMTTYFLSDLGVPFAVTMIVDETHAVVFCGSAVRNTFDSAREHATNEALMLYRSYLQLKIKGVTPDVTTSSVRRMLELNREIFNQQKEFLSSITVKSESDSGNFKTYSLVDIIRHIGFGLNDFRLVRLYRDKKNSVIRAICNKANSPKQMRDGSFVADPFY